MKDGWIEAKLEDLVDILDSKRKPVTKSSRISGDYPYYGGGGIQDYVDSYIFDGDYILLGEDGAPFFDDSRPVAHSVHGKFWANNHIHVLKAKTGVDQDYLSYYLNSIRYDQYVSNGVIPKLNQSSMRSIEIHIPKNLAEHQRISKILLDLDKLAITHSAKADVLSRIKQQLMNNKSGIIEQERQKSEQLQQYKATSADIDHKIIDICSRLPKNISDRAVTPEGTAKIIDIFTYVGEEETYEREQNYCLKLFGKQAG